jgi:hypothetical protein
MSKLNIAGIICIALGFLIILFQAIASQMGDEQRVLWSETTIEHWAAPEQLAWIDDITWKPANRAADFLSTTPVQYILFVVGGIFLMIGSLLWKR